jgi:F0F1-type ATP synthase assembly protein I
MTPTSPSPERDSSRSVWQVVAQYSYLGIFFGVAVMLGAFGGRWIERRWGGAPWVSLAGVLIGIAAGFRELYRVARRYSERG